MKTILKFLVAIIFGLVLGGMVSLMTLKGGLGTGGDMPSKIEINQWDSDWSIGSEAAGARLRAGIALKGLLALAKSEAVYFTASVDDDGQALTQDCHYKISGIGQEASWWSITLYDGDSRLPMNTDGALSFDATQAGEGKWTATISILDPEHGHWISSMNAGTFDLTLRLYEPSNEVLASPKQAVNPPKIERLSCKGNAA